MSVCAPCSGIVDWSIGSGPWRIHGVFRRINGVHWRIRGVRTKLLFSFIFQFLLLQRG